LKILRKTYHEKLETAGAYYFCISIRKCRDYLV
jgi:hypothetical protein